MTDHKDSNARDGSPTPDGTNSGQDDWERFEQEHADDLKSIERSRSARTFARKAAKAAKTSGRSTARNPEHSDSGNPDSEHDQVSVADLEADAFAGSGGPRDFRTSWLSADDVMDQGDDFVEPNPRLGSVRASVLTFWLLLVVGVAGVIGSVFLPRLVGLLATVFGTMVLIGAAGLFIRHQGHRETRSGPDDDGARV